MRLDEHIIKTIALYGQSYVDVHKHIDERYSDEGSSHRRHRHTLEYVLDRIHNGLWTVQEGRAAIQHIIDDCGRIMMKSDWMEAKDFILEAVQ